MRQESGDSRLQGLDNTSSGRRTRSGIRWILSLAVVGSLSVAGCWWQSVHHARPGGEKAHEAAGSIRREREEKPRISNPVVLELLHQDAEGKLDERQWQHVRGLSLDEVTVALSEMGDPQPWPDEPGRPVFLKDSLLRQMLFHRWSQFDPAAANAVAKAMFPGNFPRSREAVIAAWIKRGGAVEAWEAVREEDEMWACTRSVPGEVAEMIVASLSDLDDAAAFAAVIRLNDDNCDVADILCRARSAKAFATPETRAAFLAAAANHPDPFALYCARENLFKEWAKIDVEGAEAGLKALSLPEDNEEQLRLWIDSARREKERRAELLRDHPGEDETAPEKIADEDGSEPPGGGAWYELKEKVRKHWEKSPELLVDFELRDETRKLLEGIPVPDLETWLREYRVNHESDQDEDRDVPLQLRRMVLEVLAPRGAGPFIRSLAENPTEEGVWDLEEAMVLWTKHDPAAALKWLEGDVPDTMKEDLEGYLEDVRDELAGD